MMGLLTSHTTQVCSTEEKDCRKIEVCLQEEMNAFATHKEREQFPDLKGAEDSIVPLCTFFIASQTSYGGGMVIFTETSILLVLNL